MGYPRAAHGWAFCRKNPVGTPMGWLGPPMGPNIVNHTINMSLRVYRVVHNSLAILTFVSFRNITLLTSVFSLP